MFWKSPMIPFTEDSICVKDVPFERFLASRWHCLGHVILRALGQITRLSGEFFAVPLEVDTSPNNSSHNQSHHKHFLLVRQIHKPKIRRKMLQDFGKTVWPNPMNYFDFETEMKKKMNYSSEIYQTYQIRYGTNPIWIINSDAQINPTPIENTLMITGWNASENLLKHL